MARVMMIFRFFILFFFIMFLGCPLMLLVSPVRILHIPLRKYFGVRNSWLPLDLVQQLFARTCLLLAGIRVRVEGKENLDGHQAFLCMYSHVSNLDPFFLMAHSPISFKFVGKKAVFLVPIFGWAARAYGHVPIDRGNREKAVASLDHAQNKAKKWGRSIAIAPEGTRSKTGELQDFKKGAFHVAEHLQLPIAPVVFFGAWDLWPPGQFFALPGTAVVRFLPPVLFEPGQSREEVALRVRNTMLESLKDKPKGLARGPPGGLFFLGHLLSNGAIMAATGLGFRRLLGW